jgi:hypothetical protein
MRWLKESKYHNKKITVDGITFDSIKEANRWQELKLMERAGEITLLARQVKIELVPKSNLFRAVYYVADFVYFDCATERWVAEDVKSPMTRKLPDYRLKKKLFMLKYPDWHFQEHV